MRKPTDHELDLSVAAMLRIGVSLSALIVLAGGILSLRHPHATPSDYAHFNPGPQSLRTLSGILHGALHLHPQNIIQLGLVLLIATPVARVVLCIVGFARQRSAIYVAVSSIVFVILLYSLATSLH